MISEDLIRERVTVPGAQVPDRLDRLAFQMFETLPSRKSAFKAIKREEILVNGQSAIPNMLVQANDDLVLLHSFRPTPSPFRFPLQVLWEDDWLAVIHKPAGIAVNGNLHRTIENALGENLLKSNARDALGWPKPVHRLDVPTNGLLLVAKTAGASVELGRQFQRRQIEKRYYALVTGRLEGKETLIDKINGKLAHTLYRGLEYCRSLRNGWITSVEMTPLTGRTHQLRIQLANIGHPIVGDTLYGEKDRVFKGKGLFLCACHLGFHHPISRKFITFNVDIPHKFSAYIQREARRWKKYNTQDQP